MGLPPIVPADLTPVQKTLYDDMCAGIAQGFNTFATERPDGALIGPWNASLHHPAVGKASWELTKAVNSIGVLPTNVREIAILVVAGYYQAAYQIYAHVAASERAGMLAARISPLNANTRPSDLTTDEAAAFDVACALCQGGPLPEPTWQRGVDAFGELGASQLIYLVGVYSFVSITQWIRRSAPQAV